MDRFSVSRNPFLFVTSAFIIGIVFQNTLEWDVKFLLVLSVILFLTITTLQIFPNLNFFSSLYIYLILIIFGLLGALRISSWKNDHSNATFEKLLPLQLNGAWGWVSNTHYGSRVSATFHLDSLQIFDSTFPADFNVLVYLPTNFGHPVQIGNRIYLNQVNLLPLPLPRNPGQFDYGRYLKWRGISGRIFVKSPDQVQILERAPPLSLKRVIFNPLRQKLIRHIELFLSPQSAAILKALLLGERSAISPEVMQDFQNAGVIHVLAISGLHVGFVVLICYLLLSFFPMYFKWRNLLMIALLIFYTFLTGASPSVVRASLMVSLYFLAEIFERRASLYNIIFLSAFIILIFNPNQLFWSGFQFSYAAVLSIVYFYPQILELLKKAKEWIPGEKWSHAIYKGVILPFGVSLTAQLGTLPLSIFYYHKISLVSFLINILVVPFIGGIVAMGFLFLFFALTIPYFAWILGQFLDVLIQGLVNFVSLAAHLPGAYFRSGELPTWMLAIYFICILFVFNKVKQFQWKKALLALGSFLILIFLIRNISTHHFQTIFFDVGQGDAALVITPVHKTILVDAGPLTRNWDAGKGVIIPALSYLGIQRLNYVFLSHPHLDHIGGIFSLIKEIPIDSVFLPAVRFKYFWVDSLKSVLKKFHVPLRQLKMGDRLVIDPATHIYVFAPRQNFNHPVPYQGSAINNASLVILVKFRNHEILFPGDIEQAAEKRILGWGSLLEADITKIPHHGSATSSTKAFMKLNRPEIAIISVGARNKFGHPSPTVINELSHFSHKIYRTDLHRAVWLRLWKDRWHEVLWQ